MRCDALSYRERIAELDHIIGSNGISLEHTVKISNFKSTMRVNKYTAHLSNGFLLRPWKWQINTERRSLFVNPTQNLFTCVF